MLSYPITVELKRVLGESSLTNDYKDNWTKKADGKGCKVNEGYTQDERRMRIKSKYVL